MTSSLTVIVKSSFVFGLDKSSNCAAVPEIVAVTSPVVDPVTAFKSATFVPTKLPVMVITTSGSCVTVTVVAVLTAPPVAKFVKLSEIPPWNTTAPVVAFAIVWACAIFITSVTVIATSGSCVVIAVSDAVALPFVAANLLPSSDTPPAKITLLVVFPFIVSNCVTLATLFTVITQSGSSVFKLVNAVVAVPSAPEYAKTLSAIPCNKTNVAAVAAFIELNCVVLACVVKYTIFASDIDVPVPAVIAAAVSEILYSTALAEPAIVWACATVAYVVAATVPTPFVVNTASSDVIPAAIFAAVSEIEYEISPLLVASSITLACANVQESDEVISTASFNAAVFAFAKFAAVSSTEYTIAFDIPEIVFDWFTFAVPVTVTVPAPFIALVDDDIPDTIFAALSLIS